MPYIKKTQRERLDSNIESVARLIAGFGDGTFESELGLINYSVTKLLLLLAPSRMRYKHHAMVDGVLSNIAREFYRRKTAPYEDQKITENGDVY